MPYACSAMSASVISGIGAEEEDDGQGYEARDADATPRYTHCTFSRLWVSSMVLAKKTR